MLIEVAEDFKASKLACSNFFLRLSYGLSYYIIRQRTESKVWRGDTTGATIKHSLIICNALFTQ